MKAKQAPGPRGFSVLSNLFAMRSTDPLTFWRDNHAQYGDTIKLKLGPMDIWFFAAPEAIYEVFVSKNKIMRKGLGYSGLRKLLGEGLITTDKAHWSDQRQRLNPLFTPSAINAYSSSVYDACIAGMDELEELAAEGKPVDVSHAMTRLTMRVVSQAAFGVNLADGHDEIVDAFEFAFGFVADITAEPVRAPLFVPTRPNRRFKRALAIIDAFTDRLIDESRSRRATEGMSEKIFSALKDNDRKLLRDEVVSLYFAGFETTARTMTFLMQMLPQHPKILDAIRCEACDLSRPEGQDEMTRRLPFTTDVINEALRLYPPVAMMARQTNADCTIGGYDVKANSLLIVCPFVAQRNPKYWPSGEKFEPSLSPPFATRITHRGAFAPFGAGPRICLGKHFAMVELVLAVAMITGRFNWELEKDNPIELDFHGTLRPKEQVFMHLTTRDKSQLG